MIPKVLVTENVRQIRLADGVHKVDGHSLVIGPFRIWHGDGSDYIDTHELSARWVERTAKGTKIFRTVPLTAISEFISELKKADDTVAMSPHQDQYE